MKCKTGLLLENVCYPISSKMALNSISFGVDSGQILCLLGSSGSGKTTLLRLIAGLIRPASGTIEIDGREVAGKGIFVEPEKRNLGMVFQDYALFPHMTVLQNVIFGISGLPRKKAIHIAMDMLAKVGLESRAHNYPDILSGGVQQRIA